MFKIVNYFVIFLLFAVTTNFFAQTHTDSTSTIDSSLTSETSTYKLNLNPFLNSNKLFLGQKDYEVLSEEYIISQDLNPNDNSPQSLQELKLQLKDYISQRRNLLPNYDLGEFGKYLGYANAFAAVLLAIAHISKYGFK